MTKKLQSFAYQLKKKIVFQWRKQMPAGAFSSIFREKF